MTATPTPTATAPQATAPAEVIPAALRCRTLLARKVAAGVGPEGLLPAPCESRVLESALALALLTAERAEEDAAARLTAYLRTTLRTSPPDPFQRAVARAVLGRDGDAGAALDAGLDGFDHFTAGRKRLMFGTVLAALGAAPFPDVPWEAYEARPQQSWLHMEMKALKVLAAHGTGRAEVVRDEDWDALLPALAPGPAWERNNLAQLLALLALRHSPRHRPALGDVLKHVADRLRPDGGVPFIDGMTVFTTAAAGLALSLLPAPPPCVTPMADALALRRNPDGGYGFHSGVAQSDVDDTCYVLEFLRRAAPVRHRAAIAEAERYLLDVRNPDGGFPTFARGTSSEIAMTAAAASALAPNPDRRDVVAQAVRYVVRNQRPDGTFERSWSRNATNAVFRAVLALNGVDARGEDPYGRERGAQARAAERALGHLAATQHADGGWGHAETEPSDPISTAYAVIALASAAPSRNGTTPARARTTDPLHAGTTPDRAHATDPLHHSTTLARALAYLIARQRPDGGYRSRPDQAGPRPLLYDVPALADVFVLLALSHATRFPGPRAGDR
ncbi:prenyltransferase/squalene oxidase repeat-containing protein [Streptomyces sp. NPDC093111]|uniref:prenyltransferase/squalene oxidase repeat-containing protein n=1 Tax=Streptomyces sp. NPDC093111 TaxID=3154978 RepID=UPI003434866E